MPQDPQQLQDVKVEQESKRRKVSPTLPAPEEVPSVDLSMMKPLPPLPPLKMTSRDISSTSAVSWSMEDEEFLQSLFAV